MAALNEWRALVAYRNRHDNERIAGYEVIDYLCSCTILPPADLDLEIHRFLLNLFFCIPSFSKFQHDIRFFGSLTRLVSDDNASSGVFPK